MLLKRAILATCLLACALPACGPARGSGAQPGAEAPLGPVNPTPVPDADFAESTYQVLLSGERDSKRMDLLAGVVRRQFLRSARRFGTNRTAGMAALTGASYLLRAGELRQPMLSGASAALRSGAGEVARQGDEGRSQAYYGMLRSILPDGAERRDVDGHLAAMARFAAMPSTAGPMRNLGDRQRAATNRSLVEPTRETLDRARSLTLEWLKAGLDFNATESPIRTNAEREEAVEAYRAVRTGGASLVAIYLRHGDARGALGVLEREDLLRAIPAGLADRLERAAKDDDPGAWGDLYQLFEASAEVDRPETSMDVGLAKAAAWGVAVELFRSEPDSMRGGAPLAAQLVAHGMAEVAPLVLVPALGERPGVQELSWSLALILRAIVDEDESGNLSAARRTFTSAKRIMQLAESPAYLGKLRPSAGRLYYVMAALETRSGELDKALPQVRAAVRLEPTLEAYGMLAGIERQRGETQSALKTLDAMANLAKKSGERISEAEAALGKFEVYRDLNDSGRAQSALVEALNAALDAREIARSSANAARAERVLARTLEHFGAMQAARRATERAYEAARSDLRQLTATVLDSARRALTFGDLPLAREAVRQALDADLADDDLIYVALWLSLVEQVKGVSGDGLVQEALAKIEDNGSWAAKLAAWGRGKQGDKALVNGARTLVQRTEAEFYVAMRNRKPSGDDLTSLAPVAKSRAIELVEVTIARDLLSRKSGSLSVKLPQNVKVP
ncbi:MAG: hypothetical protein R3B13_34045 [Polyangiaceae bacterium]